MKSLLSKGTRDLTGRDFTGLLTLMAFGSVNSMSIILYEYKLIRAVDFDDYFELPNKCVVQSEKAVFAL